MVIMLKNKYSCEATISPCLLCFVYPPSEGGVRLPIWRGNGKRSGTQSSHPMDCNSSCKCTGVGAHTGDPQTFSAEERYNIVLSMF